MTLVTPIFDRRDGKKPAAPPATAEAYRALTGLSVIELRELGLQPWKEKTEEPKGWLGLFPHEWYPYIPEGLLVLTINDELTAFHHGETDNDKRFGALPYGIFVPESPEELEPKNETS